MRLQIVVLFLSLTLVTGYLMAGAWTQKKKKYYLKFSSYYFFTTREFNHEGDQLTFFAERPGFENASFRDLSFVTYLEYGLTDGVTLIGELPFRIRTSQWETFIIEDVLASRESPTTVGLSDLRLLSRVSLLNKPLVLSVEGGVKLPLGYETRPDNDGPPLGTGEVDLEGRLLLGKSLHPVPAYFTGGLGYRFRGGPLNDEILYEVEAGYTHRQWLFKLNLNGVQNTSDVPDLVGMEVVTPLPGGGGVVPSVIVGDQNFLKISPAIIYSLNSRFSLQGEVIHILRGANTASGTQVSLSLILLN